MSLGIRFDDETGDLSNQSRVWETGLPRVRQVLASIGSNDVSESLWKLGLPEKKNGLALSRCPSSILVTHHDDIMPIHNDSGRKNIAQKTDFVYFLTTSKHGEACVERIRLLGLLENSTRCSIASRCLRVYDGPRHGLDLF